MTAHHIVAMLPPAWGHTISYIQAAIQILKADPSVVITTVQHNLIVARTETELAGCLYDKARLRIVGVGEKGLVFGPTLFQVALEQLCAGWLETIAKLVLGSEAWPKPRAIHFDFLCGGFVVEPTKEIVGPNCKTLVWWSSALVSMPAHFTNQDFAAIAKEIYSDDSRRKNRSLEEIEQEVVEASNGTDKLSGIVIQYPGGPDMYDHERHAYAAGPLGIGALLVTAQKLGKVADGFIAVTSSCLEPVGIPYCRDLLKKRNQELFTIGMQAHELCWTNSSTPVAPSDERVRSFLDSAVSQYGKKSILYISFGSLFFPVATPHLLEALVNTLLDLEQPFPFVFALGSEMASLPPELIARINASGRGLACDFWVEQRAILQHGAVGWFLTHGGFNSMTEALTQGIPLIIWPVGGEQPVNAAFFSTGPNPVAIELFQIRAGAQLGSSLHSDAKITGTVEDASEEFKAIFSAARCARGEGLKANVAKLSIALREARAGEAAEELARLAKF
ncbi:hypothetical protein MVEN_02376100 [Mycena venus]|uniref:Glycosyltransferase family 1 protein n=1 Tax=Mycena venus TaxID=2733690 RepID=A0A8H6X2B3_9AGAR|nr:hypothetical protein MVEN_02376100 [Mycena venus]